MANYKLMIPKVLKWEGGWSDDPADSGGATMKGVTLATFRRYYGLNKTKSDLRKITNAQWEHIFKVGYWDRMKADDIRNQSLAELCVQTVWGSGPDWIRNIQRAIDVKDDGIVGPKTLAALNENPSRNFHRIWEARRVFFFNLCYHPDADAPNGVRPTKRAKFYKGWMNRLNSYKYSE